MLEFDSVPLHPAQDVVSNAALGANTRGVYGIFFDRKALLLERSGYLEFDKTLPIEVDDHDLLYVGASIDPLRRRVLAHLTGNSKASSLRMTLGAILTEELLLDPIAGANRGYYDFGFGEARLSQWIVSTTRIGFYPSDDPYDLERDILRCVPLPLNIDQRKRHRFSRYLLMLRGYYSARPTQRGRLPVEWLRTPGIQGVRQAGEVTQYPAEGEAL
jgi:hypothetical protein